MPDKKPTTRRIRKTPRPETGEIPGKQEPAAQPDDKGPAEPNDDEPQIVSALNEAVQALAQSLTNIATTLQERQAEQTQKYYAALMAAAPQDDGDQLSAAYQTVLDAVASQDANRIAAAQKSYVQLLSELMSKLTERSEAATMEHMTGYEDLIEEAQHHGQEQYFNYIDTLRNVMNKASEDNLKPTTLLIIVQNMASAAMLCQGFFSHSE